MEFKTKKRNTSVATLIRNYQNKKSGKVTASKKEIQDRFKHLDWKDQKKILMDYLQSGKTDRAWASRQLINYWDPCFEPIVKELWENLREECLTWSIIRFFPKEYLKQNFESLSEDRNYYFLCLRLSDDDGFDIDESKLSEIEYLNIMLKSGRTLTEEHATKILFTLVSKLCTGDYDYLPMARWPTTYFSSEIPDIMAIQMIRMALYKIFTVNQIDLFSKLCEWKYRVLRAIEESKDFHILKAMSLDKDEYELKKQTLTKKFYYNHLDTQYKLKGDDPEFISPVYYNYTPIEEVEDYNQEEVEEQIKLMKQNNPIVGNLIEDFDLEIDGSVPF